MSAQARVLRELREHLDTLIHEHSDMSIREARVWLSLLDRSGMTVKRAQRLGFAFIAQPEDVRAACQGLDRFIRAFAPGPWENPKVTDDIPGETEPIPFKHDKETSQLSWALSSTLGDLGDGQLPKEYAADVALELRKLADRLDAVNK